MSLGFIRKEGLREPLLIVDTEGLDIGVPSGFGVAEILKFVGTCFDLLVLLALIVVIRPNSLGPRCVTFA